MTAQEPQTVEQMAAVVWTSDYVLDDMPKRSVQRAKILALRMHWWHELHKLGHYVPSWSMTAAWEGERSH